MVADSEITISTTKYMAGTDAAPLLSYLGRLVSLNALVFHEWIRSRFVGNPETEPLQLKPISPAEHLDLPCYNKLLHPQSQFAP